MRPNVPLNHAIKPSKQEAQRHYGSHPYFTKRAWNVVQEYIKHFTAPGETVLDPFGGSGVTAVESLVLHRKAIYVDINPWACFLARQTAIAPVDLATLQAAFGSVEDGCRKAIEAIWHTPNAELGRRPPSEWYPKGVRLPQNADATYVEELFTPRMLHGLAKLRAAIVSTRDRIVRDLLLMAFSATLVRINRTFLSAANRAESRGGSAVFSIYRYKVAARTIELPLWPQFEQRFRKLLDAKRETNRFIGDFYHDGETAMFHHGSATALSQLTAPESVDYIYTDPPYGAHIAYLDLSTMWTAWLKMKVSAAEKHAEVIEGGSEKKSRSDYEGLLRDSLREMQRVLKPGKWLSIVFAHRDTSYWDALVSACEDAGLQYCNTVVQPVGVVWSMHKKKNPLKVLSGELVLNFRKAGSRSVTVRSPGLGDPLQAVRVCCESEIAARGGASTEDIHHAVVPALLEQGLLDRFSREHGDLIPLLQRYFLFDTESKNWHLPAERELAGAHDPQLLLRYYVSRFLQRVRGHTPSAAEAREFLRGVLCKTPVPPTSSLERLLRNTGSAVGKHAAATGAMVHEQQREIVFQD